jgi:hypothetical protein
LTQELELLHDRCRRTLILHDTSPPWGFRDEPQATPDDVPQAETETVAPRGLWPAVVNFLAVRGFVWFSEFWFSIIITTVYLFVKNIIT